jgi:hypothetical protein
VQSFTDGLRSALREDPDVILLGEMRDLDSIAITLTLAETGHLVFATLHTNDASQALDRIVDVFPAEKRDQIQTMLAGSLQGVVSQRLLPQRAAAIAAYEVLMANDAVATSCEPSRQFRNTMISGQREHADHRDGPRSPGCQRDHQPRPLPVPVPSQGDHGASRDAAVADAGTRRLLPARRNDRFRSTRRRLTPRCHGCVEASVQDAGRHRAVPGRLADPACSIGGRDRERRGAGGLSVI